MQLMLATETARSRELSEALDLAQVGWKEWWLVHKVLPRALLDRKPLRFAGIRIAGAANKENRELFFEDLAFFNESFAPLTFEPRPKRGIDPFPGQSPGAPLPCVQTLRPCTSIRSRTTSLSTRGDFAPTKRKLARLRSAPSACDHVSSSFVSNVDELFNATGA